MKQPTTLVLAPKLVLVPRLMLVPKLQLGNPESEALASQDRKLELPGLSSQAGAWELADVDWVSDSVTQQVKELDLKLSDGSEISGYAALTRSTTLRAPKLPLSLLDSSLNKSSYRQGSRYSVLGMLIFIPPCSLDSGSPCRNDELLNIGVCR